jgi:hypothetical protein
LPSYICPSKVPKVKPAKQIIKIKLEPVNKTKRKETEAEKIREESYLAEAHHRGPASQPT